MAPEPTGMAAKERKETQKGEPERQGYPNPLETREHRNIIVKHWGFSIFTREQTREQPAHGWWHL
jgi:hypothetical protein